MAKTVIFITLVLCLCTIPALSGCMSDNNLKRQDVQEAFDQSLQNYSHYFAQDMARELMNIFKLLSFSGTVEIDEPERPISNDSIAGCYACANFTMHVAPESLLKIPEAKPPRTVIMSSGHTTLYYCGLTVLATVIIILILAAFYYVAKYYIKCKAAIIV